MAKIVIKIWHMEICEKQLNSWEVVIALKVYIKNEEMLKIKKPSQGYRKGIANKI